MSFFYVFDLDGTLSDPSARLHHVKNGNNNWDQFFAECGNDLPKWQTIRILNQLKDTNGGRYGKGQRGIGLNRVEIWSGRSDIVRQETIDWLNKHDIQYDNLRMRKHGDHRPDVVIKKEWLDQCDVKPDVIFDDRQSVVDMWRKEGVVCFQVDQWREIEKIGEDFERIKPLKTDEPMLIVMVGPSGAGKTTISGQSDERYAYISSDLLRQTLCGDFKNQSRNVDVFRAVHTLIKTYIDCGIPVIYDATNIRNKDRIAAVKCCPEDYKVQYWVVDRPLKDKIRDGAWRNEVIISKRCQKQTLIEYHDQVFKSNLKDIMNGDGLRNVEVIDYRIPKD